MPSPVDPPEGGDTTIDAGGVATDVRVRRRQRSATAGSFAAVAAIAVAAALLIAPRVSASGPVLFGQVTVTGSQPAGVTRVAVGPVGAVAADTHRGPLGVEVRVDAVDIDRLGDSKFSDSDEVQTQVTGAVERVATDWIRSAALLAAVLGMAGGVIVSAFTRRRRWQRIATLGLFGAAVGAAAVLGGGVAGKETFDPTAFANPSFEGALRFAPDVLDAAGGTSNGLNSVAGTAAVIGSRIEVLADAARGGQGIGAARDDDVVILHVGDLHLNPLGAQLVGRLAGEFEPDAIVDTGDFTSFGMSDLEALYAQLVDVDVPYYLTPGNHDSKRVVERIREDGVVTVVDGDVVDIAGLRYGGLADPTFTPAGGDVDRDARDVAYQAQHEAIRTFAERNDIDVIGLHNPAQASALTGPGWPGTVLSGHIHEFWFEIGEHANVAVVGTTGSDGIAALGQAAPGRYAAQLLRFRKSGDSYELWSLDRIQVDGDTLLESGPGRFRIERIDLTASDGRRFLSGDRGSADGGPVNTAEPPGTSEADDAGAAPAVDTPPGGAPARNETAGDAAAGEGG